MGVHLNQRGDDNRGVDDIRTNAVPSDEGRGQKVFWACELDEPGHILVLRGNEKSFKIRLADTEAGRNSASMLIKKMYAWRGYAGAHDVPSNPNRITLTASDKDTVVGTITLNLDSPVGLLADDIFKAEIDAYRQPGAKLCELTKLAIDSSIRSMSMLAALFHIAFIYGRRLHRCTAVFIEVNPRHLHFYQRMLGFEWLER